MDLLKLEENRRALECLSAADVLTWASEVFGKDLVQATSLGAEDQVLTHLVADRELKIEAFVLDTGRHFEETYKVLEQTREKYKVDIRLFFPESELLEPLLREHGPNFFRKEIAMRKQCCAIRKIRPLKRALAGRRAWLTGLRRDQAVTRGTVEVLEWDAANGLVKINPLWRWTQDEVWDFIRQNQVPYNALHEKGFPSIGCAPCTRAIQPGEDLRAGRWWWELPEQKECGLHWENGKPVRIQKQSQSPQSFFEEVSS